jgi:hypothetical protein
MIPIIIKSKKKIKNKNMKTIKYINKSKTKKQLGGAHRGHRGSHRRSHRGASNDEDEDDWNAFEIVPVDGRVCMLFDQRFGRYRPAPHIQHVQQDIYGPVYPQHNIYLAPSNSYDILSTS